MILLEKTETSDSKVQILKEFSNDFVDKNFLMICKNKWGK
jgi:hypothetical protein